MFGLSTWEVLIILAVALIFIGPDQLPKVARQIGKGVRQVRGAMGKVDTEMRRAVREAAAEVDDDGNPVAPRPETVAPEHAPPAPLPERDWSQVGKNPVPGRVATATTPAPTTAPDGEPSPPGEPPTGPPAKPASDDPTAT
jgi:sec-independent protein translocase protein TatB